MEKLDIENSTGDLSRKGRFVAWWKRNWWKVTIPSVLLIIAAILVGVIPFPVKCQEITISSVIPNMICLAQGKRSLRTVYFVLLCSSITDATALQGQRELLVVGSGFMTHDNPSSNWPSAALDNGQVSATVDNISDCHSVYSKGHSVQNCAQIAITLPETVGPLQRMSTLTVDNASPCTSDSGDATVWLFSPPNVNQVIPPMMCIAQGSLVGDEFFFFY